MKTALRCFMLIALAIGLHAQDCDSTFMSNDPAVVLSTPLQSAISALVNTGADVRVRVVSRMGTPTLDAYELALERSCPSWQATDSGRKNNLVAVLVATKDHKTGTYFGAQWPMLKTQWPRIQSQVMAPRFHDGDIAGGLALGLAEIRSVLVEKPIASGSVTVVQPASAPMDLSGLWSLLLGLVLFSGLGLLILVLVKALKERKQEQEARRGAQQKALIAQQKASSLMAGANSWGLLTGRAKSLTDEATQAYGTLGMGVTDPSNGMLTASQYDAITDCYDSVTSLLKSADCLRNTPEVKPAEQVKDRPAYRAPVENLLASPRLKKVTKEPEVKTVVHHVHHDHHDYAPAPVIMPVIIEEPVSYSRPVYRPDPPATRRHDDDDSSSSSWGSSSSSGGSSDWGSSSSDSGSSSWGSSDSGGGGSSDW